MDQPPRIQSDMDIHQLAQRLQSIEHFQKIPLLEVEKIILSGKIIRFDKDQTIFSEDEPSAGMFVLLNGQVQLCKISHQGQISILSIINPVIMFNEVSALDDDPNPITAITNQESTLWQIDAHKLQEIIVKYPQLGLGLLRVLAKRNRKLVSQFQDLSFLPLLSRTAKLLLEISNQGEIKINRKENPNYLLAAQVSTGPEAFSRCLKTFRHQKMITSDTHKIEIIDLAGLQRIAYMNLEG